MTATPQGPLGPNTYPQHGYGPAPQGYPAAGFGQPGHGAPAYPPPAYPAPVHQQLYPSQPGYSQFQHPGGGRPGPAPGVRYASWGARLGAALIDGMIPFFVMVLVVLPPLFGFYLGGREIFGVIVPFLLTCVFVIWNLGYRQGRTGQSIGKKLAGIRLVRLRDGRPVGFGVSIGRQFAHVLDAVPFYLGYLWPLWDERAQTFADKVCNTVVVRSGI